MALATLGAVGGALIAQSSAQPGARATTQYRDQAKDHVLATRPAPPPRLLPGNAGGQAANAAEPSLAAVRLATRQVEQAVRAQASSLAFSIDQSSGKAVVTVTDSETGEVLRQIPSEEMLSLSQTMNRMQGLLLSQRA